MYCCIDVLLIFTTCIDLTHLKKVTSHSLCLCFSLKKIKKNKSLFLSLVESRVLLRLSGWFSLVEKCFQWLTTWFTPSSLGSLLAGAAGQRLCFSAFVPFLKEVSTYRWVELLFFLTFFCITVVNIAKVSRNSN